jgi:hypothetical protein
MRKRKINLTSPYTKARHLAVNLIIITIVFIVVIFILGYGIKTLKGLRYFKIKDIMVNEGNSEDFSYLKNRNIFYIDLKDESRYISGIYPVYSKIRLIRVLPNRLFIDFIRRKAIAYIKLYRYFCVDEDLTLFDDPKNLAAIDLPVILGLETKIYGPKTGRKCEVRELALAVNIIKELNSSNELRSYKVKSVNVSSAANASLLLQIPPQNSNYPNWQMKTGGGVFEIRIGNDNIKQKVSALNALFTQIMNDPGNIRYIDLRFKEPVIKFRDVK